jgi:hypothetical protein
MTTVVVVGLVPNRVIGAGAGTLHAAVVIVGVVPGRIVGAWACGRCARVVVVGVMPDGVVMPMRHDVNVCRMITSVVVMGSDVQAGDTGERHASLQGFQDKTPLIPFCM